MGVVEEFEYRNGDYSRVLLTDCEVFKGRGRVMQSDRMRAGRWQPTATTAW